MTDRDRAWDAEHHRAALQIITEADRGLRVAEHELKGGRLMDARETVRLVRGLLPPLERVIQRRPVRAEGGTALTAVVRRVRELHRESRGSMSALYPSLICECGKDYPCPTIRALDATPETGGES